MTVAGRMAGRLALITGASRGFGKALTAALLDRGWTVVGDARRATDLENTAAELNSARLIALLLLEPLFPFQNWHNADPRKWRQ